MAEQLKNLFNRDNIQLTAQHLKNQFADFDQDGFYQIATDDIDNRELKDRANQIYLALVEHLPNDYLTALNILMASLQPVVSNQELTNVTTDETGVAGWIILPYSQFVGEQGQGYLTESLDALKTMTQLFSSEFGIRYFILKQQDLTLRTMLSWTQDECHHVRRLVSEGSRPLLPWAMQLPTIKADPNLTLPLLNELKTDSSEYVRRSVANHLNDIAKHHPDFVADVVEDWFSVDDKLRFRMLKHACRSLIKQGHVKTLAIFGYQPAEDLELDLSLSSLDINLGESLGLTLSLSNQHDKAQNLLVDFVIYHQKANGTLAPKVFKWKELRLKAGESFTLEKKHVIKPITTRNYYSGEHKVTVQINGKELTEKNFLLTC